MTKRRKAPKRRVAKVVKRKKTIKFKWNSPLKAKMKKSGRRLVHGYETTERKRRKKR